jgi:hypothetical protein
MATADDAVRALPSKEALASERQKQLRERGVEAALLERNGKTAIRYRPLSPKELASVDAP